MERTLPLPAAEAFDLLADLGGHGRWIPLTRMAVPAHELAEGDEIVARTAGVFVDRMRIERLEAPRVLELRKLGPVLLGTARIEVRAISPGWSRVRWTESVHLRGPLAPEVSRALLAAPLAAMTGLALSRIGRHLEQRR